MLKQMIGEEGIMRTRKRRKVIEPADGKKMQWTGYVATH